MAVGEVLKEGWGRVFRIGSRRFGDPILAGCCLPNWLASLHFIARRFAFSMRAAASQNRVCTRYDQRDGGILCKHNPSVSLIACLRQYYFARLVPYLMEFILILAFTSAMARMREISTSLSAWWTFWLTSFT